MKICLFCLGCRGTEFHTAGADGVLAPEEVNMQAKGIILSVLVVVLALGFFPGSIGSGNAGDQPLILAQRGAPVAPGQAL